ncbi:hypothetical protein B484DRAFT_440704 [Ochromonadaceae sp. CCMP2298]|nr:hypothetical protein B484DRAFT_440704 [Ochromonadaceae sp. CCMP2298]
MVLLGLVVLFLCLGGWGLVRRFWVQSRQQKALHTSHYSVVSSLGGASERMRQNSVKAKNTGSWKSARFQSFGVENDAQDAQDQYADVVMPFAAPDAHAARTIEDKSQAAASAEEQLEVEQQDEAMRPVQVPEMGGASYSYIVSFQGDPGTLVSTD